jgi:CHAD domain-containing protein
LAYRFEQGEGVEAGFRRIANEQLAKILRRFDSDRQGETTIHEARKSLKRLKALLKLVRLGLAKKDYRREYDTVRDAGRRLSGVRDFEVMPATLASLKAQSCDLDKVGVEQVAAAIARAKRDFEQTWDCDTAINTAVADLKASAKRFAKIAVDDDFEVLAKGAGKCLALLRAQGERALATGHDEDFHEWRKSAQLHWRHLRLLSPVWPELITARITVTRALADVLGYDHDLAVLAQFITAVPDNRLDKARRGGLDKAIKHRQSVLRDEARAYAGLLIIDEPSGFSRQLMAYRQARSKIAVLDKPFASLQVGDVAK